LQKIHNISSYPIHLAADSDQFASMPRAQEFQSHVVFVGTMISPSYIEQQQRKLPTVCQKICSMLNASIDKQPYGTNPFQHLDETVQNLPDKLISAYKAMEEQDPEAFLNLRTHAWMLGKNEVRKRILKATLEGFPLLILCGNWERTHATEQEIRKLLKCDSDQLIVRDTASLEFSEIAKLYAYGKIHIQATDPQSVQGGIPFRVFQTTAAARPLLTDKKPELAECYCYGKEIFTFDSENDFATTLQSAVANPTRLNDVARAGHERFLRDHTWEKRFEYVRKTVLRSH
jgi:hypothetical protein